MQHLTPTKTIYIYFIFSYNFEKDAFFSTNKNPLHIKLMLQNFVPPVDAVIIKSPAVTVRPASYLLAYFGKHHFGGIVKV